MKYRLPSKKLMEAAKKHIASINGSNNNKNDKQELEELLTKNKSGEHKWGSVYERPAHLDFDINQILNEPDKSLVSTGENSNLLKNIKNYNDIVSRSLGISDDTVSDSEPEIDSGDDLL